METTTHTPGPWRLTGLNVRADTELGSGALVATVFDHWHSEATPATVAEEKESNARLIASAPDLLLQLKEARQYVAKVATDRAGESLGTFASRRLDRMDAAIAKAEGGAA